MVKRVCDDRYCREICVVRVSSCDVLYLRIFYEPIYQVEDTHEGERKANDEKRVNLRLCIQRRSISLGIVGV